MAKITHPRTEEALLSEPEDGPTTPVRAIV